MNDIKARSPDAPTSKNSARSTAVPAVFRNTYAFLETLPEFSKLTNSELQSLAASCRFATIAAGQFIATEGDEEGIDGFIVVSGCLAMSKTSPSGKILTVELLQSGDIFGLMLMLSEIHTATQLSARALKESIVLWMPIRNYLYMVASHPELLKGHVTHLLRSLQSSYALARGLAHDKVEVRIAAVLTSLALKLPPKSPGTPASDGAIQLTRQQLADLTGTTSETAIRVTGMMQREEWIDIKRPGHIRVLDQAALTSLVEDW